MRRILYLLQIYKLQLNFFAICRIVFNNSVKKMLCFVRILFVKVVRTKTYLMIRLMEFVRTKTYLMIRLVKFVQLKMVFITYVFYKKFLFLFYGGDICVHTYTILILFRLIQGRCRSAILLCYSAYIYNEFDLGPCISNLL